MEKEGTNKQAPLLSQGLWPLNNCCPHPILALIRSPPCVRRGRVKCALLTQCLCQSYPAAAGQPLPDRRVSAAVLITLPGLSEYQLL